MQRIKQLVDRQVLLNKFRKPVWKDNTFKDGIDWSEARRLFSVDDVERFAVDRLKHALTQLVSNELPLLVKQHKVGTVGVAAHEHIEAASLVAIYPGVTFTPVDLMTILAFENLFDDVKWIWSFKTSLIQQRQPHEEPSSPKAAPTITNEHQHHSGKTPHHTSPVVNPKATPQSNNFSINQTPL